MKQLLRMNLDVRKRAGRLANTSAFICVHQRLILAGVS